MTESHYCQRMDSSRSSVIVRQQDDQPSRSQGHNEDRLTPSYGGWPRQAGQHGHDHGHQRSEQCWHDHEEDPGQLEGISYEELEQRLPQPSEMFRHGSFSHSNINIDIDNIFAKFSDLVKGSIISSPEEQQQSCEGNNNVSDNEGERDDKRPVSDCGVCGDRAIAHLHYGGICCYSCKAFFRRAVQSGKDKAYSCKRQSRCEVSVNTRRGCQKCRFEKCLSIGMTGSWVLSDEQCEIRFGKGKKRMGDGEESRRKEGSKRRLEDEEDGHEDDKMVFDQDEFSDNDRSMVEHLVKIYQQSWEQFTFSESNASLVQEILSKDKRKYSSSEMNSMVTTVIQRGIFGMNNNHHFSRLSGADRKMLLVKNMSEMCLIRGALRFNTARKSFIIDLKGSDKPAEVSKVNAEIKQDSLNNLYASDGITRCWETPQNIFNKYTYIFQQNFTDDGAYQADGSTSGDIHHHDHNCRLCLRRSPAGGQSLRGTDSSPLYEPPSQVREYKRLLFENVDVKRYTLRNVFVLNHVHSSVK